MSETMRAQLEAEKPTIKILIYTDNPEIVPTNSPGELFGLGSMLDRLETHAPNFAKIKPTLISRNPDDQHPAENKLDAILSNEEFDEIWFFGIHQANTTRISLGERRGGPESELNQAEVETLRQWMKVREDGSGGGGVLMAGDHSNETPNDLIAGTNNICADTSACQTFLGLGRALGRCVPRAGSLRKWEGPPSYRPEDRVSTIFNFGLQQDAQPQQLTLRNLNADGDPDPNGQPHPLFFYKEGQFIQVFPDHTHEGAVIVPDETVPLDPQVWPTMNGKQPRPHVVAFGRDARRGEPINVIATYNGDLAGVGRIVADSTWHHYMNLNLTSFPESAPEGSVSDQIGQFYGNLAAWLAPQRKRQQMSRAMLYQLALYVSLMEPDLDAESTGASAHSVLMKMASPCEVHEFWQSCTPRSVIELYSAYESSAQLPSRNLLLGSVLKTCQSAMFRPAAALADSAPLSVGDMIEVGLNNAFRQHVNQLRKTLDFLSPAVKPQ